MWNFFFCWKYIDLIIKSICFCANCGQLLIHTVLNSVQYVPQNRMILGCLTSVHIPLLPYKSQFQEVNKSRYKKADRKSITFLYSLFELMTTLWYVKWAYSTDTIQNIYYIIKELFCHVWDLVASMVCIINCAKHFIKAISGIN